METSEASAEAERAHALHHGIEHRLQVGRRAADDAENLAGRGLLLQRLGQLALRACSSSNSRTFSIAITAWSAKVVTSSICLGVNGRSAVRRQEDHPADSFPRAEEVAKGRAVAADLLGIPLSVFRICQDVRYMDHSGFENGSPGDAASVRRDMVALK